MRDAKKRIASHEGMCDVCALGVRARVCVFLLVLFLRADAH